MLLSRNLHPYHICTSLQLKQVGVHNSLSFLQQPAISKTGDPVSTRQLIGWTNYSSFLVWSVKRVKHNGFHTWVRSLGGIQQLFFCVLGHFRHGDDQVFLKQACSGPVRRQSPAISHWHPCKWIVVVPL